MPRTSRHNRGRKPLYKEHGANVSVKRAWDEFYVGDQIDWHLVEEAANKLLPDMPPIEIGPTTIFKQQAVNTAQTRKFGGLQKRQNVGHFAQRLDAVTRKDKRLLNKLATIRPNKEPPPLRDTAIEYHHVKLSHAVCDKCGKPRLGYKPLSSAELKLLGLVRPMYPDQKGYCKACYRILAREKREELRARILIEAELKRQKMMEKRETVLAKKDAIFADHRAAAKEYDEARKELDEATAAYSYWMETFDLSVPAAPSGNGEGVGVRAHGNAIDFFWGFRLATTPDFTIRLLDVIEKAEVEVGIPYALWLSADVRIVPNGDREIKRNTYKVFRHDLHHRQNIVRMQQTEWRYSR